MVASYTQQPAQCAPTTRSPLATASRRTLLVHDTYKFCTPSPPRNFQTIAHRNIQLKSQPR